MDFFPLELDSLGPPVTLKPLQALSLHVCNDNPLFFLPRIFHSVQLKDKTCIILKNVTTNQGMQSFEFSLPVYVATKIVSHYCTRAITNAEDAEFQVQSSADVDYCPI